MISKKYTTKKAVMKKAKELVDAKISFAELDKTGRLSLSNKGDLGQIVEEGWYEYKPNNDSDPDFSEAGIELKVSPYKELRNGQVSAKERLVCNLINYCEEADKTFETSSFWHKNSCILLLSYKWKAGMHKGEMFVDKATLICRFPDEDLCIIRQDWEKIIGKIRAGKAEELSEGDTLYLSACTKGSSSKTMRKQPYSSVEAKQRAYSLKASYMTRLLRWYVFGGSLDSHVITDWRVLEDQTFEEYILHRFDSYIGKSIYELSEELGISIEDKEPKAINNMITRRILGIHNDRGAIEEFANANITVKNIPVDSNGNSEESTSFPAFSFKEIILQEWEESDQYEQIATAKFLYVIYLKGQNGISYLEKVAFWNMPAKDIEEVHRVWDKTVETIKTGVTLEIGRDGRVYNNLPKQTESCVAHVRPHTRKRAYKFKDGTTIENEPGDLEKYADELPDGQWMTKQSFWLNESYTSQIVRKIIGDENETS